MPRRRKKRGHYHVGVHVSKTGESCKYRSGWELLLMKYMDDDSNVTRYFYESLKIPYVSNKKTKKVRNYIPDFLVEYVDGTRKLIEVKPKRKLTNVTVKKKVSAAAEWCKENNIELEIITEVELRALGLL